MSTKHESLIMMRGIDSPFRVDESIQTILDRIFDNGDVVLVHDCGRPILIGVQNIVAIVTISDAKDAI